MDDKLKRYKESADRHIKDGYGSHPTRKYDPKRCVEYVARRDGWGGYQCARKSGQGMDGLYCKQHSPENVIEKNRIQSEKWKKEWAEDAKKRRLSNASKGFYDALKQIANGHNDARSFAKQIIEDFEKD